MASASKRAVEVDSGDVIVQRNVEEKSVDNLCDHDRIVVGGGMSVADCETCYHFYQKKQK
jgi:hypothetical protein